MQQSISERISKIGPLVFKFIHYKQKYKIFSLYNISVELLSKMQSRKSNFNQSNKKKPRDSVWSEIGAYGAIFGRMFR